MTELALPDINSHALNHFAMWLEEGKKKYPHCGTEKPVVAVGVMVVFDSRQHGFKM